MTGRASRTISRARLWDGTRLGDDEQDIAIADGRVERIAPAGTLAEPAEAAVVVLPGFVDAHVHLSFASPPAVLAGGVTAVLDLGEPDSYVPPSSPLRYRAAGPILTAPGGYPTRSWGAGGFGREVDGPFEARSAVAALRERGAAIVKVALQGTPSPDAATLRAITASAQEGGLTTIAHALSADAVAACLDAGIAALAHTPVDPLDDATIAECGRRGMIVVSTVRAFGDAPQTRDNLKRLAGAGCRVAYGTDLGNGGIAPGIDADEVRILAEALGSFDAAIAASVSTAAALAGLQPVRIEEGAIADLVVCRSLDTIGSPAHVIAGGWSIR